MIHGKNPPQSYEEMSLVADAKRGSKMYRAESSEFVDGEISRLVDLATLELAALCDRLETVSLEDTKAVKAKAIEYLRACAEKSIVPTMTSFCHALGYSEEGVRQFRIKHPKHPTADFLELFHEECAETLNQTALRGYTERTYSIFAQKAKNQWKDSIVIEPVMKDAALETVLSAEEIAAKYQDLPGE